MHIDEALRQIADIRVQMVRTQVFRGYRSATVALSGLGGIAAALVQGGLLPEPAAEFGRYVMLWVGVAGISLLVAGAEVVWRAQRSGSGMMWRHTRVAVEQFLPAVVVGGLLTLCIAGVAAEAAWLLPGLWSFVFGLGVFAMCRVMPRAVCIVGAWYIACGCGCILLGRGEWALSPWLMGITFGGGQLIAAAILYWALERGHGSGASAE